MKLAIAIIFIISNNPPPASFIMTYDTKIDMWLIPYILYVGVCLRQAVFMSYLYDQFFFIIFIFATNVELYNSMLQIIILTKTIGFFSGHFLQSVSLRVLLSFYLIFCQFQHGVAYKNSVYLTESLPLRAVKLISS